MRYETQQDREPDTDVRDEASPRHDAPTWREGDTEPAAPELTEAERREVEELAAERAEADQAEIDRAGGELTEEERLEAERLETERLDAERRDAELVDAERAEAAHADVDRIDAERVDADRIDADQAALAQDRDDTTLAEVEHAEAERDATERAEDEAAEAERVEDTSWAGAQQGTTEPVDVAPAEAGRTDPDWAVIEPAATEPSDLDSVPPGPVVGQAAVVAVATPAAGGFADEGGLWPAGTADDYQQRWRDVQLYFVDDPRAAAEQAHELMTEVLDRFSEAVAARKTELDSWRGTGGGDTDAETEQMRRVVRGYRKLLDRVLAA